MTENPLDNFVWLDLENKEEFEKLDERVKNSHISLLTKSMTKMQGEIIEKYDKKKGRAS